MLAWLRRLTSRPASGPLSGAPARRRVKNYAALTGYAYEYLYAGYCDQGERREYVFTVSGDRKEWFALPVCLPGSALHAWETAHGRTLAGNERYALAKLALFSAFDDRANPAALRAPIEVSASQAAELLDRLEL